MTPILLLLLFPFLTVVVMKIWRSENFTWVEAGAQILLSVILIVGVYQGGRYLEMTSVEFWNGQVTSKHRDHGTYEQAYDCFCTTDSKGNTSCQTCYETHYTVKWYLKSTVGRIGIKSLDRTSRSVYNTPNPKNYVDAYVGEPCSVTNSYLNYVQAATSSLFNRTGTPPEDFIKAGLLPAYPQLHSIYKLNHVQAIGVTVPKLTEWNDTLAKILRSLGATKQINIFVLIVNTTDQSYIHALQQHWRGANKNDAVVVIGSSDGETIAWADVFSWSKEPEFDIIVRNEITKHGKLEKNAILGIIQEATVQHYVRQPMAEFEYLKDEIEPPTWVMVIALILAVPGSLLLAYVFDRVDLFGYGYGRSIRRRRFRT